MYIYLAYPIPCVSGIRRIIIRPWWFDFIGLIESISANQAASIYYMLLAFKLVQSDLKIIEFLLLQLPTPNTWLYIPDILATWQQDGKV